MAQSAQHFYRKLSHMINGSEYFHQLCKRVVLSAWLLHSAFESTYFKDKFSPQERLKDSSESIVKILVCMSITIDSVEMLNLID